METIYITKYALTEGIFTREATIYDNGMAVLRDHWRQSFHGEGREWHRTEESAKARAEVMRQNKIASLEKSIAKMKSLKF